MDAKQARDAARQTLVGMRGGTNPNEERRRARARGITLREGLDLHLNSRRLADKTRSGYEYHVTYYLKDWLDRPLAEIGADRQGVRERHRRITERSGATSGDNTMRVLRSVYNRALRQFPDLPPNPVGNVDMNGMRRRELDASPDKLKAWGKAVLSLGNPVRRDLQLFMLLSGMRRTALCEARRADLGDGHLHVPNPKGGSSKKFDLPLSTALADLLAHREAVADSVRRKTPYLFPADSASGRVAEVKQHELGDLTGHADAGGALPARGDLLLAGRDVLVQPLDRGEGAPVQQVQGRGELADLLSAEERGVAEFDLHCSCAPVGCGPPVACHERIPGLGVVCAPMR